MLMLLTVNRLFCRAKYELTFAKDTETLVAHINPPKCSKNRAFLHPKMNMNYARASNVSAEIFKDQAVLKLCDSCWAYI